MRTSLLWCSVLFLGAGCPPPEPDSVALDWSPDQARTVSYAVEESYLGLPNGDRETRTYQLDLAFSSGSVTVTRDGAAIFTYPTTPSGDLSLTSDADPVTPLAAMLLLEALPEAPLPTASAGDTWDRTFPADATLPPDKHARQFRFAGTVDSISAGKANLTLTADQRRVDNARFQRVGAPPDSFFGRSTAWSPAVDGALVWDRTAAAFESGELWFAPVENPDIASHAAVRTHPTAVTVRVTRIP